MRLSAKITAWHRDCLVFGYIRLSVEFDLIVVLRSQFFDFLRETLYKHALEHLEAAGPNKTGYIASHTNAYQYLFVRSAQLLDLLDPSYDV